MSDSDVSPVRRALLKAAALGASLGVTAAAGVVGGCVAPGDSNGASRPPPNPAPAAPATQVGPARFTLAQAADALRQGTMRAETYLAILLDQARAAPELGAIVALDDNGALDLARRTDAARAAGSAMAPLAGTALLLSDAIDFAGLPVTCGTPALRGHRPVASARVPQGLITQGMVVLGKTNVHELSLGATSSGGIFGDVRNPHDPARIAGGASGGAAAAVAAGLAPAALASEGLASAHIGASLCGACALRPTLGDTEQSRRYPLAGLGLVSHTRDTIVPVTRTVADLAMLDASITGTTPARPVALPEIRLGLPRRYFWDGVEPGVAQLIEGALEKFRARGVVIVEADLPEADTLGAATALPVQLYEMLMDFPAYLWQSGGSVAFARVLEGVADNAVKARLQAARGVSRAAYSAALRQDRPRLIAAYRAYFARHRVHGVLLPTVPVIAPPRGPVNRADRDRREDDALFALLTRNTTPGGMAGLPALSFPVGTTAAGLPVGVTIDAPAGGDQRLLGIGLALQPLVGYIPLPAPRA